MLVVFTFHPSKAAVQILDFNGYIFDNETNRPIPFAAVQALGAIQNGAVTDLRGWFAITDLQANSSLVISHVGYEKLEVPLALLRNDQKIFLTPLTYQLDEVQVVTGENPAIPIIRKAINNKPINNPEQLDSYKFESYNKMVMTLDGLNEESEKDDTTENFLQVGHFFMAESYSEVVFKKPGNRKETVKASKMSGIENPLMAMASSSFQPFSFYTDYIKILEVPYINPLSTGGLKKYDYFLEDSISNGLGTSYIITFQPKEGKVYQLGKGLMHISSIQNAIENFLIRPSDPDTNLIFELQQKNKWDGNYWFPEQMNSIYLAPEFDVQGKAIKIINQTFISKVELNKLDQNVKFGPVGFEFDIQNERYDWGSSLGLADIKGIPDLCEI